MVNIMRKPEPRTTMAPFRRNDPFPFMRELMWDPFREMGAMPPWEPQGFMPSFDVRETKDALILEADLPGVSDKDVAVMLTGNRLAVSGERRAEEKHDGENYFTLERAHGTFTRTFTLPDEVDGERVEAELRQGVLTLWLPKRPEAKSRQIPLKTGS